MQRPPISYFLGLILLAVSGLYFISGNIFSNIDEVSIEQLLPPTKSARIADSDGAFSIFPNTRLTNPDKSKALWILTAYNDGSSFIQGSSGAFVDRSVPALRDPQSYRLIKLLGDETFTYIGDSTARISQAFITSSRLSKHELLTQLNSKQSKRELFLGLALVLIAFVGILGALVKAHKLKLFLCCLAVLVSLMAYMLPGKSTPLSFSVKVEDPDVNAFVPPASKFDEVGNGLLASLPNLDVVPSAESKSAISVEIEAHIFASDEKVIWGEPITTTFGGLLERILLISPDIIHLILLCVPISLFLYLILSIAYRPAEKFLATVVVIFSGSVSIFSSIFYSNGWDELFINLRHSYSLANFGRYSYNFHTNAEATVDFVPFFLAGILAKIGFPLLDSLLAITLSGNLLVMSACYLISKHLTNNKVFSVCVCCLMALFPCLLMVAGTGFTATFFSGWALLGLYFFLLKQSNTVGLLLLSTLTLVRTEGILLAGLALFSRASVIELDSWFNRERFRATFLKYIKWGIFLSSPFLLSCLFRYWYFGLALPVPISFKNAGGDLGYLIVGIGLLKQGISAFHLDIIAIILLVSFLCASSSFPKRSSISLLVCLFPFGLSYYSGGGDWFPVEWNRYMMPLTIVFWIVTAAILFDASRKHLKYFAFLPFLICFVLIKDGIERRAGTAFWSGRQLSWLESSPGRWGRVQKLAAFGSFLKATTPEETVVASPEMSTLMYYAERNILDLLGIANPDIALTVLQPLKPGDLMHRKRNPDTINRHLPGIIALFEMAHTQPNAGATVSETEASSLLKALAFSPDMITYGYYRVGAIERFKRLGYQHVAIFYKNIIYNYFVHDSIFLAHVNALKEKGLIPRGTARVSFDIPAELVSRFDPGSQNIKDS